MYSRNTDGAEPVLGLVPGKSLPCLSPLQERPLTGKCNRNRVSQAVCGPPGRRQQPPWGACPAVEQDPRARLSVERPLSFSFRSSLGSGPAFPPLWINTLPVLVQFLGFVSAQLRDAGLPGDAERGWQLIFSSGLHVPGPYTTSLPLACVQDWENSSPRLVSASPSFCCAMMGWEQQMGVKLQHVGAGMESVDPFSA